MVKRALAAVFFAAGYAMSAGAPAVVIGAAPFVLSGCEKEDNDLEDAAEDVGDEIEDAAEDVEDKLD